MTFKNTQIHYALLTMLTSSLAFTTNAQQPNINSGLLTQQLEQAYQQKKIQPSGDVFTPESHKTAQTASSSVTFRLNHINVLGFDGEPVGEDLSALINPYLNKSISLADLQQLTQNITQFYRNNNYLVARAILPPQDIVNSGLHIVVIKGQIGEVTLSNNSKLHSRFVQKIATANLAEEDYLRKTDLEKIALLLNDLQGIKPNLSLRAGKQTGTTDLHISLADAQRFNTYVLMDNQGNKETGEYRFSTGVRLNNLIGFGDDLRLDVSSSDKGKLKSIRADYSGLIDGYGTKLGAMVSYLDYQLGGDFKALGAKGYSNNLGVYVFHPTLRLPNFRLNTKVAFNHQFLGDKQMTVSVEQKRRLNTLGITFNGSWRSLAKGTSYFSFATTFGNIHQQSNEAAHYQDGTFKPKKSFTTFNYAFSHEQLLPKSLALNLSLSGQFTDKNLDSSQKMLLGGQYAVRGYSSGTASIDEGHLLQAELKHFLPIFKESILTSSVFYDYGRGKYYKNTENLAVELKNKVALQSVGASLSLSAPNNYAVTATLAKPIGQRLNKESKHQFWFTLLKTF